MALLAAGCSDPLAPASPTPVAPTVTETFQGTLTLAGVNTHPFPVGAIGGVAVTVSSIEPAAAVGIGVGTPSGGAFCNMVQTALVDKPGTTPQLAGSATTTGNFCISVYDTGALVEPVSYTVTVLHP